MEEIRIGDYCRTKNGFLFKFDNYWLFNDKYKKVDIVNHSPNLIDLIQCGDYVNGHLIIDIPGDKSGAVYLEQITKGALIPTLKEEIQTIVTKEMMESISYKVK